MRPCLSCQQLDGRTEPTFLQDTKKALALGLGADRGVEIVVADVTKGAK